MTQRYAIPVLKSRPDVHPTQMKFDRWLGVLSQAMAMMCVLTCIPAHADSAAEPTVVLSTTEFAPYMSSALQHQGVMVEIANEAYRREGYALKVRFLPWARALGVAEQGEVDGMVGIWYSREREQWFNYSKPILANQMGFYRRVDHPITFKSLNDLHPYVIGIVHAYANPPAFDAAHLHTDEANDDLTNLRKLAAGRLDLVLVDRAVARYLIERDEPTLRGKLTWVDPPIDLMPLYCAISRRAPDADKKLAALNAGLDSMARDGTLSRLVAAIQ